MSYNNFIFFNFNFYFWLRWVFVAAGATLRCGAWASPCSGFSFGARALGRGGFSSCGAWAQ